MPGRLMIWVVAAGGVACAGADPDAAPADEEMTSGAVTALLPREGRSYLAGRALPRA